MGRGTFIWVGTGGKNKGWDCILQGLGQIRSKGGVGVVSWLFARGMAGDRARGWRDGARGAAAAAMLMAAVVAYTVSERLKIRRLHASEAGSLDAIVCTTSYRFEYE
eukprot:746447-Hanusia_phi.AAC.2